jgi:hypothetical protein
MQRAVTLLFDAFFFVLITGAVATAWQWPFATGLFPLTIGIPVLVVALGQLVKDIVVSQGGTDGNDKPAQRIRDIAVDHSIPTNLVVERAGSFFLCALGFFATILLVGFKIAVPIFMAVYLRLFSKAGWVLTLILTGLMTALVLGVFDEILNVPWPDSLLGDVMGIDQD